MLKKIFSFVIVVLGGILFIVGYYFYNSKINNLANAKTTVDIQAIQKRSSSSSEKNSTDKSKIDQLVINLPKAAQDKITSAIGQNKKVTLTLLVQEDSSVEKNFKSILEKEYGSDVWNINTITYGAVASSAILNSGLVSQVVESKPDIIIYEAPLLLDNLNITDSGSTESNTKILSELSKTGAVLFVEPSNPIYKGNIYPTQVSNFKSLVATKYNYIDFWSAYPEQASDGMKKLVIDDGVYHTLNAEGQKIWENYLTNLFVAK